MSYLYPTETDDGIRIGRHDTPPPDGVYGASGDDSKLSEIEAELAKANPDDEPHAAIDEAGMAISNAEAVRNARAINPNMPRS